VEIHYLNLSQLRKFHGNLKVVLLDLGVWKFSWWWIPKNSVPDDHGARSSFTLAQG
jgi:hypothetical protein